MRGRTATGWPGTALFESASTRSRARPAAALPQARVRSCIALSSRTAAASAEIPSALEAEAKRFFDTNILVYSEDRAETSRRFLAQALVEDAIATDEMVVSTQVLLEFYATALRRKLMRPESALDLLRFWSEHHVVANTADFLLRGLELQQAHELSVWDSLIVQAAIESRCDVLLSEDLQHGMRFGALEIRNPFIEPPRASEAKGPAAKPAAARRRAR